MDTGRLNRWQVGALALGLATLLGLVLYPPWRCTSGAYRVSNEVIAALKSGAITADDFAPNTPMIYCDHRTAVAYGWLFRPPTAFAGRRWQAELDWVRLAPRCSAVLVATVALLLLLGEGSPVLRLLSRPRAAPPADGAGQPPPQ